MNGSFLLFPLNPSSFNISLTSSCFIKTYLSYTYVLFCYRKTLFDAEEDEYVPMPEDRPGGFAWGAAGGMLGGADPPQ